MISSPPLPLAFPGTEGDTKAEQGGIDWSVRVDEWGHEDAQTGETDARKKSPTPTDTVPMNPPPTRVKTLTPPMVLSLTSATGIFPILMKRISTRYVRFETIFTSVWWICSMNSTTHN